jgi:transposase InsO family protein
VDVVEKWSERSGINVGQMIKWLGIGASKYYNWKGRRGQENHHNAPTPRRFWLEDWEKAKITAFYVEHPNEGYRRLSYMMLDADVVAASPSSVYRVLKKAGMLKKWAKATSKKGKGFHQPQKPHQHWHIDIAYINICGTFYYLCSVLDGYSRYVVHWEIRESMTETDVEIILERAREKFPTANPRIISDNGPQFVAKSFKEYIRLCGMTHVRTAPFYPQSNGKLERWHKSLKTECIRPKTPLSLADARRIVAEFVKCYNTERLHSAIGYVTPKDKLEGREAAIFADRKRKLAEARERRARRHQQVEPEMVSLHHHSPSPNVGVACAG